MIELKRYTIMSSAKGPNRDTIEDPDGQWIFDPGHKINLDKSNDRRCEYCGAEKDPTIKTLCGKCRM